MMLDILKSKTLQLMIQGEGECNLEKYTIGDLLKRVKNPIDIEDDIEYKRVTIRTKNKGILIRDTLKGIKIGTKKQFLVSEGLFLLSKIDARNGAFGIAPNEINGAIVTNDFLAFEVNVSLLDINWFNLYVSTDNFKKICEKSSFGSTNRKRLKEDNFLSFEVYLPSVEEQRNIVEKINKLFEIINEINKNKENMLKNISDARRKVLQLAIQGKLVEQYKCDEPVSSLLQKIVEQKERLIKEKKIKKEKKLPEITEEEKLFKLPNSWEWCRLGEISSVKGGKRVPAGYKLLDNPTEYMYIRVADMKNGTILENDIKYISSEIYEKIKNYYIESDDIYMTIAGTIGRVGTVPEKFNGANLTENASKIKCYHVSKEYIFRILNSDFVQKQISDKTKKVGQPKLALNQIESLVLPIPPLEEQHRIVAKVNKIMHYLDELEKIILKKDII